MSHYTYFAYPVNLLPFHDQLIILCWPKFCRKSIKPSCHGHHNCTTKLPRDQPFKQFKALPVSKHKSFYTNNKYVLSNYL